MSIKPSRGGPAAAFSPSELVARSAKAARTNLSLARRSIQNPPSRKRRRADQADPAEQSRARAEMQKGKIGGEEADGGEPRDVQREHEGGHGDADSDILAIDPDVEQHCRGRP